MKLLLAATLFATTTIAAPASATAVYMTGQGDPWGQSTNEKAMDVAFGGKWEKYQGFTAKAFDVADFIFMDGGDGQATEFGKFLITEGDAFAKFLEKGGRVLVHAAPNQTDFDSYGLPSDLKLGGIGKYEYPTASDFAVLTDVGVKAGLGADGAGSKWTGNFFSHNAVFGGTCLIKGAGGCILASSGNLLAGGETTTNFHYNGDPLQLRVNELKFASGGTLTGAVPEPASWAMLIAGFGLAGAGMRRRRLALA